MRYGTRAQTYLRDNGPLASLVLVGILALGFIGYLQWRKAQRRKSRKIAAR
jgi:hypothetical protein